MQRQQAIQEKKAIIAANKLEKQKIATEKRLQKAAEKQLQKSFQDALITGKRTQNTSPKRVTKLPKTPNRRVEQSTKPQELVIVDEGEDAVVATLSSRRIQRPARFAH